jgi:hypothetical protein
MGLFLCLGLLHGRDLRFRQDRACLSHLGLQRLQPLRHVFEVMALPHAAHAEGRDDQAALAQFVGDTRLAPGWLLDGDGDDGLFDLGLDAVCGGLGDLDRIREE